MEKGALSELAIAGAQIAVRVTPKASRNRITHEGGKATKEVVKLLAHALGVPKLRLKLLRGETSRDKVFGIKG